MRFIDDAYIAESMTTAQLNAKLAGFGAGAAAAKIRMIEDASAEVASMLVGVHDIDDIEGEDLPLVKSCTFMVFCYKLEQLSGIIPERTKDLYSTVNGLLKDLRDRRRVALDSDGQTPESYNSIAVVRGKNPESIGKIRRVQGGFDDYGY